MNAQSETVQESFIALTQDEIADASQKANQLIMDLIEKIDEQNIPNHGEVLEKNARIIRRKTLENYKQTKIKIASRITEALVNVILTSPLDKLQKKNEEINILDAEIEKVQRERSQILNKDLKLSDYKKFELYGEDTPWRSRKRQRDKQLASQNVKNTATEVFEDYALKSRLGIICCIAMTVIFSLLDFSFIYTLFQNSNFSVWLSVTVGLISAFALDGPPCILGYYLKKKGDDIKLRELRVDSKNDKGQAFDDKWDKHVIRLLIIITVVVLTIYLGLRILTFFGGGDFNVGFHALISKKFQLADITFSSADLMTAVVPLVTSVMSFAVGRILFCSHTDYVKKAIAMINKALEMDAYICAETIVEHQGMRKNLTQEITTLKQEIWAFYCGKRSFPQEEAEFEKQVFAAFQEMNMYLYSQTYQRCSDLLRSAAIGNIQDINKILAAKIGDPKSALSMTISDDEEKLLDELWVIDPEKEQHHTTQQDLKQIKETIEKQVKRFSSY